MTDHTELIERLHSYVQQGPLTSPFCETCRNAIDALKQSSHKNAELKLEIEARDTVLSLLRESFPECRCMGDLPGWVDELKAKNVELVAHVERLRESLEDAMGAVKTFHGPECWDIYESHSPEMKRWKAALSATPAQSLAEIEKRVLDGKRLWLWKNFVDGKPEYWAFDNPFPIHLNNDDPQILGEPCGYAIFKPSRQGRTDVSDDEVLRRMAAERK